MKRLTAGLLLAATVLLARPAIAQIAPATGPVDITANELEVIDPQHMTVWRGDVDVIRGQDRLRADKLNVYFSAKRAGGAPAPGAGAGGPGSTWGNKIDHMVAEGHVFFVSPTQTARGDHAYYDLGNNTVTVTGDVIVVQGQNVIHGDKLIINQKTGRATMVSPAPKAAPRVRGIFYPSEHNSAQGASAAPAAQP